MEYKFAVDKITAAEGDVIDFQQVLGRSAKGLQIEVGGLLRFKMNHRIWVTRHKERVDGRGTYSPIQQALVNMNNKVSQLTDGPVFEFDGQVYQTPSNLGVDVLEIIEIDPGATVVITCW